MKILATMLAHLARPMPWILSGLLMASGGVYAQETMQKMRQRAEMSKQKTDTRLAFEKLLQKAGELIKGGKPAEAYGMLAPLEFEYSGEERFDYLIGIAALDSGKPDKATLAFERLLMVNPNLAAARLDMARSYYQLGDMPRARGEFETVLKQNPSVAAKTVIQKYLDSIAARESGKKNDLTGYIEGMTGADSNVNYATSQSQIFVDVPGINATLDPGSVKIADNYYAMAAGGEVIHTPNARWGLYVAADMRQRSNISQKNFDTQSLDARTGLMFKTAADHLRVGLLGSRYNLGGAYYGDSRGVKGEWRHKFSPANQLTAFVQHAEYRFADVLMQPNDYIQQTAGAGWLHVLASGKSSLFGSLYYGSELDISTIVTPSTPEGGRIDGARRFNGMRIGGQTSISDNTTLFINAGGQNSDYNKINHLFLRQRNDHLYDMALGASWRWDRLWTLRAQLSYSINDSNIAIYDYDRTDVSLTVRRDFR
ncbi:MAG TPA: tetratricopeptide repeat protein [Gallionellaceae bacterium]|nr:tetratricopeptide repeat protein [Gallionellaceae bacterium]